MHITRLAKNAMGTRFELVLPGDDVARLRAAGEAALAEIARVEAELSPYCPTSQLAHINAFAAQQPVKVTPELFGLLQRARAIWRNTQGAFDITVGPLLQFFKGTDGSSGEPNTRDLQTIREFIGLDNIELNSSDITVRFRKSGVQIDLGAIGKGYAIDTAVAVLHDVGVQSALIHAGTSTIYAFGTAPGATAWKVAVLSPPHTFMGQEKRGDELAAIGDCAVRTPICVVELADAALSVSAIWGRFFRVNNRTISHIVDPRTGTPVQDTLLSAVLWHNAAEADALSTALVVLGQAGLKQLALEYPGIGLLTVAYEHSCKKLCIEAVGGSLTNCVTLQPDKPVEVQQNQIS